MKKNLFTIAAVFWGTLKLAAQISVTATGGTTGPTAYTNFTTAFAAINSGTHTGSITVSVSGNFSESATPTINSSGTGSASYTAILIKPAAGATPVITNTGDNTAAIKLDGADNVTIDGSNAPGGTSRDLTFVNTNSIGSGKACNIWLASKSGNGATNNVIKNCKLAGSGFSGGAAYMGVCIYSSNSTLAGYWEAGAPTVSANSNNLIQNNLMNGTNAGVVFMGGASVGETGNQVIGNVIGDNTSATNLKFTNVGVYLLNQASFKIDQNTFTWISAGNTNVAPGGISIGAGCTNGTIARNTMTNIRFSQTTVLTGGILLRAGASNGIAISNNFISDVASAGSSTNATNNAYGIAIGAGTGYDIAFNSVHMNTNPTTTANGYQAALYVDAAVNTVQVRNNLLVQASANTTNKFSVYAASANPTGATIDYNDYYSSGTSLAYAGSAQAGLTDVQANLQNNLAHSKNVLPVFVSATDLHLQATNASNVTNLQGAGIAITGINVDFDGTARPVNPTLGAHELVSVPCTTPAAPTAPAASRCGPGTLILTATGATGTTLNWYSGPTGGPVIGTGSPFTTPSNSATTTYYVSAASGTCESPRTAVVCTVKDKPVAGVTPAGTVQACAGSTLTLTGSGTGSYQWLNATGPIGGAVNTTLVTGTAGNYRLVVTNITSGCADTTTAVAVTINPLPVVSLGRDTIFCSGNSLVLDAGNAGASFLWDNSATTQTRTVTNSGTYFVKVTNSSNCLARDTIQVTVNPTPTVNLGIDTNLCEGISYVLQAGNTGASYLWNDNTTAQTKTVTASGSYSVKVTNGFNCSARDTVVATFYPIPVVALGSDKDICADATVILDAGNPGETYIWDDGSTQQTRVVDASGTYYVTVSNIAHCKGSDTVQAIVHPLPVVNLGNDTVFCHGNVLTLDAGNPGAAYLWSDNSTDRTLDAGATGTYSVVVTDQYACKASDAIDILVKGLPQGVINAVYGEAATYTFNILDAQYVTSCIWDFGDGSPSATVSDASALVQHTYHRNGIFPVRARLLGQCNDSLTPMRTVEVFDASGTGIPVIGDDKDLLLYPNPATDRLILESKGQLRMVQVIVSNVLGQVVYNAKVDHADKYQLPTGTLGSGMYTVIVATDRGTIVRKLEIRK
ncbi:Ig-like domain-containing protein [Taibaiella koreensis]|uniref:Ig-like domain-containing protein n=1 Tax=Taibaiella koreensis TaxID=1268548 RepID=UPI0013C36B20|nr:T9SS type A sorting domain-containing protein [Taibaiella koreensis]